MIRLLDHDVVIICLGVMEFPPHVDLCNTNYKAPACRQGGYQVTEVRQCFPLESGVCGRGRGSVLFCTHVTEG